MVGFLNFCLLGKKHARRKRRKIDPNYREKMEKYRTQGTATAVVNPHCASSSSVPVSSTRGEPQSDLSLNHPKSTTGKQVVGKGDLDERLPEPTLTSVCVPSEFEYNIY